MDKDTITEKWNNYLNLPFPEIEDVDLHFKLAEIDASSAGCITRYIDGKIDQECIGILKQILIELPKHLDVIKGTKKSYFELLYEIIEDIKFHKRF